MTLSQMLSSHLNVFDIRNCLFPASDAKAEMRAALWRIPTDFDQSTTEDNSASSQSLEHVSQIENEDYGDMKWSVQAPTASKLSDAQ